MIQRAASFESNKENTLRADGNDCLAAVRWSLCSFTRWMRRMAVYRDQSHAGIPLRRLLRTGLLSVLSILQLLRGRVLLATQPDHFSVYQVQIPVTDKSQTHRHPEDCPAYRCAMLYWQGALRRNVPLSKVTAALLLR
jgi:hypothetical protein